MADVYDRRRDWSQLNPELLELIAGAFTEISDHFRFRSVCRSWRSSYTNLPLPRGGPCLLVVPDPYLREHEEKDCLVISPFDNWQRFTLRTPYSLEMKSSSYVFGSPYGYFVVFNETTRTISITNPLDSGSWFTLPVPIPRRGCSSLLEDSLPVNFDLHLAKIFMSDDSKLTVIVSDRFHGMHLLLFLWRTGDSAWTQIYNGGDFADFVLYKGSFYIVDSDLLTTVLDSTTLAKTGVIEDPQIETDDDDPQIETDNDDEFDEAEYIYFVESSCGELLMVEWNHCNGPNGKWVFQLDFSKRQPKWMRVRNIGDDSLFLHNKGVMCFPTGQLGPFKKNCVYFINDYGKATFMNIEDNKLEVLPDFIEKQVAWILRSCSRASCTSEQEKQNWGAACLSLRIKLEASEAACLRSEIEAAKLRSQFESEFSMQRQLLSTKESDLLVARNQIKELKSEFSAYKDRAHALLQKKDAELTAARNSEIFKAQEEALNEAERELAVALAERDKAIQDLEDVLARHDKDIADRDAALNDAELRIRSITMKLDAATALYLSEKDTWEKNLDSVEENWKVKYRTLEAQRTEQTSDKLQKDLDELRLRYRNLKEEHDSFRDIADLIIEEKEKEIVRLGEDNKNLRRSLESRPSVDQSNTQNSR